MSFSLNAQTNPDSLKNQMEKLIGGPAYRTFTDTSKLNQVADWIFNEFKKGGHQPEFQEFEVNKVQYKNVIVRIGSKTLPTIVIGAHYDVCGDQQGADDNASGVVGMISAYHQLKEYQGQYCLEFVAYTLEEPPFFGTQAMGSYIHAQELNYESRKVFGMVSVEMIGFFSDKEDSQSYPVGIMKWFYGKKADFIFLSKKMTNGKFVRGFTKNFMKSGMIKTHKLGAPKSIVGVDFSDHRNYWKFGYDAFMLTDTSFYRNKNYHQSTDTIETIDFSRMAKVVDALVYAIQQL